MKLSTIWLIIITTFFILGLFRVAWITYHIPAEQIQAQNGVIDFTEFDFNSKKTVTLRGEWEFYPDEFIDSEQFQAGAVEKRYEMIPHNWQSDYDDIQYGTYRLTILLPENDDHLYGMKIIEISTAANIYLNGKLLGTYGKASSSADEATGKFGPETFLIHPETNEVELIIHASNFDFSYSGGMSKAILFGQENAIISASQQSKQLQLVVGIIFFLHSLYAFLILFLSKGKIKTPLHYFGIMLILHGFTILIDDDVVLTLPVDVVTHLKILLCLFMSTLFSLLVFIKQIFAVTNRSFRFFIYFYVILLLIIIVAPLGSALPLGVGMGTYFLIAFIFLYRVTIKKVRSGFKDGIFVILFLTSYLSNIIWGGLIKGNLVQLPYYPFDFVLSIIFIAILLIKQHIHTIEINLEQTEKLKQADKLKDEFLANTSHEVRNPLHGIINIAQSLLDNEQNLTKQNRENLELLINIGKRMNVTLNDLTAVSELKEGKVHLRKEPVNLHAVSRTIINMLEFLKEGKQIELRSNISASFPKIIADENRLIQIMFNLVHNAIKYTEEGHITIDATYDDDYCTIYVKDTGIGIDNTVIEKIFQPYERLYQTHSNYITGIGIGLSVSKQLVELHGGTISFKSSDQGTTFQFTIPMHDAVYENDVAIEEALNEDDVLDTSLKEQASEPHEAILPTFNNKRAKILIVDDDPVNIKVLKEMLRHNYTIFSALNGKQALEHIDRERLDLVIADVMMPHMSGYELTLKIREKYSLIELPVLLMTARGLPEDIETAFHYGANDYLVKPVNALELKTRIEALTFLKFSVKESLQKEAALLKAQIQPHFLFNTLNSIAALGRFDPDRMIELLEAFGTYLERSFANKNVQDEIPLQDEIELIEAYLHIEKERFGDRIHVLFDIDDDINVLIPPLSIQPLVENAIQHGILAKLEGGTVSIIIKEIGDRVKVMIKDDGVGMNEAQIEKALQLSYDPNQGIGIHNINRRLIQLYGSGITIDSVVDEGTTVSFEVPFREVEN